MLKRILIACCIGGALVAGGCEMLNESGLSNDEIVNGLKTALEVGTDSSVMVTSSMDGFYKDAAIKIFLPDEAQIIVDNINKVPGGSVLLENVLIRMNRAAEDAAKSATPIFKNAITGMSISDGLSILNGVNLESRKKSASFDSTAATGYLKTKTYTDLVTAFATPINASLDKKLVGNISTNDAWNQLTSAYNTVVDLDVLNLLGLHKVNVTLGEHVTRKALNGLFLKVGETEIRIRRNPWQWISTTVGNILTKVFGS